MAKKQSEHNPGDNVRVKKPGQFKDYEGEVISTTRATAKVNLAAFGSWFFNHSDLELITKSTIKSKAK